MLAAMGARGLPGRPLAGLSGPFRGLARFRVLDFTKLLPGPYASQVLSDLGMRVTQVELPYFGDLARDMPPKIEGVGSLYWMLHQGKRLLSFDFRKPQGLKRLHRLIRESDALLEGFRPGLMERIGLGEEALRRINPRLVYCSLTGYPPEGPWRRKAGHDLNFLAMSGFLAMADSQGKISFPSAQVADLSGSIAAVAGILAALLEREKTGRGRHVTVAMAQAAHSWLAIPLASLRATGREPRRAGEWWNGGHPFYRLYEAKDGRPLAVAALEKGFALALLDVLGLSELKNLLDDPMGHSARLGEALSRAFRKATRGEWEERLKDKDVCVSSVLSLGEAASFLAASQKAGLTKARNRRRRGKPRAQARTKG